jgi:hypothetical protein
VWSRRASVAVAPAVFVVVVEGAVRIVAAITDGDAPIILAGYALPIGLLAGLVAPILILGSRRPGAVGLSIASVCLTALGLGIGFLLWLSAAVVGCGGVEGCFG